MAVVLRQRQAGRYRQREAEPHAGGQAGRRLHPALLLAPGPQRRRQLPHVPGRSRREEARRHRRHAAARRARLPDARQGRHRHRHRTATRRKTQEQTLEGAAAQPPARLPRLRQGRRMPAARLQLPLRPRHEPDDRRRRTRRPTSPTSASTSRCSPTAASCARAACRFTREIAGTGGIASHQPRPSLRDRHLPRRSGQQQAGGQRRRSVPGRGALANKDFLYKQRVWFLKTQKSVCAGLQRPAAASTSITTRTSSTACGPRENPQAQGHFMCDEGRFDYRLRQRPRRR